jgi:hypothetical protein
MSREFSPEERLLYLIKGRKKPEYAKSPEGKPQDAANLSDNIIPVPVPSDADGIKGKKINTTPDIEENSDKQRPKGFLVKPDIKINPAYIGITIILLFVAGALYFIFNITGSKDGQEVENLKKLIEVISETKSADMPAEEEKKVIMPAPDKPAASFEDYQKLINAKSIFTPPVIQTGKTVAQEGPGINELIKDLRLVGIMPGEIPQAIIEDRKNNQTLFLKEGDMINDIEIKNILAGRVVLARNDETVALSL